MIICTVILVVTFASWSPGGEPKPHQTATFSGWSMRSPSHVLMPLFDSVKSSRVGRVAHLICVLELCIMTYDSKGKKEWEDLCESS